MENEEYADPDPLARRKSRRFKLRISIDIVKDEKRYAFGEVVDISREGAAIEAQPPLVIGESYYFHFRGFGSWPGQVVRKFDVNGHGVEFNIDETQKRRIDEIIRTLLKTTPRNECEDSLAENYSNPKIRAY